MNEYEYVSFEEEVLEHEREMLKSFLRENKLKEYIIDAVFSKIYDLIEIYKDLLSTFTAHRETIITFKTERDDERKLLEFIQQIDEFKLLRVDYDKGAIVVSAQNHNFNAVFIEHMLAEIARFARKLKFKAEFEENIDSPNRLFIYDTIRAGQEMRSSAHFVAINNKAFKFFCSCEAFALILSDKQLFDDLVDALAYNDLQKARKILRDTENETTELYKKINDISKFYDYISSLKIDFDVEMVEDLEKEFAVEILYF